MNTSTLTIHSLDYESRGVARGADGKTVFVVGALPRETVVAQIIEEKSHFNVAKTQTILQAAAERVEPLCPHYQDCGGCSLQHAEFSAQVAYKQRVFAEQLARIGKVQPEMWLPPIYGTAWHYRNRTKLSVHAHADGSLVIGYLGKKSRHVMAINQCKVLTPPLSGSLKTIFEAVAKLHQSSPKSRIEALELYHSDNLAALNIISKKKLPETALNMVHQLLSGSLNNTVQWQIWQQQGKTTQLCVPQNAPTLAYKLPEFGLTMPYQPNDFTQVNQSLNEIMVARAMRLLAPQPNERIADLFCGLGNFSLPIARSGAQVVGIEGLASLTQRASDNARANGLKNVQFQTANLFEIHETTMANWDKFDKMLLDPPRAGAAAVVQALHTPYLPQKIVYVSCNPATFARDAAILVQKGYRFESVGVMNLFAQTAHIEAIGVFVL